MNVAKYSRTDNKGRVYVDCSECERGGNGGAQDKCACGWQTKRGGKGGCYLGTLIGGLRNEPAAAEQPEGGEE